MQVETDRIRRLAARLCLCIPTAGMASLYAAEAPTTLHLVTEDRPPTNMLIDGKIAGSATDRVRALMTRAGVVTDIRVYPWKRAYNMALHDADTCVYATRRTHAREALFKWVGPVATSQWMLYGAAKSHLQLKTLEDARPYVIGTQLGDWVTDDLQERHFKVDSISRDELNAQKLLSGRIDLWASTPAAIKPEWNGAIVPQLTFNNMDLYLACNLRLPDQLIERLNAVLKDMRSEGNPPR